MCSSIRKNTSLSSSLIPLFSLIVLLLSSALAYFYNHQASALLKSDPISEITMEAATYTLPPLPYAYNVIISPTLHAWFLGKGVSLITTCICSQTGTRARHLGPDHGASPLQASPDLHHQLERGPHVSSPGSADQRHPIPNRQPTSNYFQRRRPHQSLSLLAKPVPARLTKQHCVLGSAQAFRRH